MAAILAITSIGTAAPLVLAQKAFAATPSVVINEISAFSSSDWVELYNTTSGDISLTNYSFHDAAGNTRTSSQFPSTTIAAHGFLVVDFGRSLDKLGDTVTLLDGMNAVDSVSYGSAWSTGQEGLATAPSNADTTVSRSTDGGSTWVLQAKTEGATNNPAAAEPLLSTTYPSTATVGVQNSFTTSITKNGAADNLVRVKIILDNPSQAADATLEYESAPNIFTPLTFDPGGVSYFGSSLGFQLADATTNMRVTFHTPGTYGATIEIVKAVDDSVLGTPLQTSVVVSTPPDTTPPSAPTGGTPNNAFEQTNDFFFKWNASTDDSGQPVTYEFQSDNDGSFTNPWDSITNGNSEQNHLTSPQIHSTGAPDGTYFWRVRAIDASGNTSDWSDTWKMTIDTQAPATPQQLSPANGQVVNGASVTNSWTSITDAKSYEYRSFNDAAGTHLRFGQTLAATSKTAKNVADGTVFYWQVRAVDAAGNTSDWSPLWQIVVDSSAPTLAITSPNDGSFVSGTATLLKGTETDANPATYRWIVTNAKGKVIAQHENVASPTVKNFKWDTTAVKDGGYTITLSATDAAGNTASTSIVVTVDNTTPNVRITKPTAGDTLSNANAFTIKGKASDTGSGLRNNIVVIRLVDAGGNVVFRQKVTVNANGIWKLKVPKGTLQDGQYKIIAVATDNQGNKDRDAISVALDSTAPVATIDPLAAGTDTTPTLTGTIDDANALVAVSIDGGAPENAIVTGNAWKLSVASALVIGTHNVRVVATDQTGNVSSPATMSFVVSSVATPTVIRKTITLQPAAAINTPTTPTQSTNNTFTPQVLGTSTTQPTTTGHVLGDKTNTPSSSSSGTKTFSDANAKKTAGLLGLAWYWWVLIVVAILAILYTVYRKADTDTKAN